MTTALYGTTNLVVVTCWCGIVHAVPDSLNRIAKENHKHGVFCPLGHEWVHGGKTEAEELREELKYEKERRAQIAADRDQAEASLRATKGVVTKLKKRVANGVCPCCGRTFKQLAAHMQSKHPEYVAEASSPAPEMVS